MSDRTSARNKLLLLRSRLPEDFGTGDLIAWSRDSASEVRDWATFALAVRDEDSEEIRLALLARVGDEDFEVRSEALWGLGRRQDLRGAGPLTEALAGDPVGMLMVEAAGLFARPELVPLLERLLPWPEEAALIEAAIARCRGERTPDRHWDLVEYQTPSHSSGAGRSSAE